MKLPICFTLFIDGILLLSVLIQTAASAKLAAALYGFADFSRGTAILFFECTVA